MTKGTKLTLWIVGAIFGIPLLAYLCVWIAGATLDREHTATVRMTLAAPPDVVFAAIVDVEQAPSWRDIESVEVLDREPLRWRETSEWGEFTFVEVERVPGRRFVSRIDGGDTFGGTWTFVLEPAADGERTDLSITEDGWIDPPVYRALTRWAFGYDATARAYIEQLAAHLE